MHVKKFKKKKTMCFSNENENAQTTDISKKLKKPLSKSRKTELAQSKIELSFKEQQADFFNKNSRYVEMDMLVVRFLLELGKIFGFGSDIEPSHRKEIGLCILAIFILENTDTKSSRDDDTAYIYLNYLDISIMGQPLKYKEVSTLLKNLSTIGGIGEISLREICEWCMDDLYLYLKNINKPSKYWRTKGQKKYGSKISKNARTSLFHACFTNCELLKKEHYEIWLLLQEDFSELAKK